MHYSNFYCFCIVNVVIHLTIIFVSFYFIEHHIKFSVWFKYNCRIFECCLTVWYYLFHLYSAFDVVAWLPGTFSTLPWSSLKYLCQDHTQCSSFHIWPRHIFLILSLLIRKSHVNMTTFQQLFIPKLHSKKLHYKL